MERLTTDKTAREMTMTELAHNCMYVRDRGSWYRDFDREMDLFDFIREFSKAENSGELPDDNEALGEMLLDGLQYSIHNPFGRVALVYRLMWAMANLRGTLKAYEDTGLTPEQIREIDRLYAEKCKELAALQGSWIPVEESLPEDSKYILLSFSNVSLPMVGRYEKEEEGGAFYLGDCDEEDTCVANDLSVNAWMPLPRPYRPEAGAALAGPDRAGLTPGPVQESDILHEERCKGPAASGRKGIPVLP